MTILYNCHHDGDQYRITKFVDGNPESSYLTTHRECDCPAGVRPTCRHRQMLPFFLGHNLINSHLFVDWDGSRGIVDFEGNRQPAPRCTLEPDRMPEYLEGLSQSVKQDITSSQPAPFRRRL